MSAQENLYPARTYAAGIGDAVADRTINRLVPDGLGGTRRETWGEVAARVTAGNVLLGPDAGIEQPILQEHIARGALLMSGRHLQHGDLTQPERPIEVYTNCLHRSTEILTLEHGPVAIADVVGQFVTVKARDGEWRKAFVRNYGRQALYRITFCSRNGIVGNVPTEVIATANHRWFLRDGSVTDELKVGDWLEAAHGGVEMDPEAIVHGLVYGDGSAHKSRHDHARTTASQGRTYASIRVAKKDSVRDEIHEILDNAGFRFTTPPHANGDRVYYIGKKEYFKELPFTNDPAYIAGFIHGWWLADGSKYYANTRGGLEISTCLESAARWLKSYAAYAGYMVSGQSIHHRKDGDGSFANGKSLYCVRLAKCREMRTSSIEYFGEDDVFCVEEPVTTGFVLGNGLLTGNCSTAAASFLLFNLLLNGSGVGRSYDDAMMVVDWSKLPVVVPCIREDHPDVLSGEIKAPTWEAAVAAHESMPFLHLTVDDSREGWARAIEHIETMTFEGDWTDTLLLLDFSNVRERGAPIKGMQNRPASGPGPLMNAISNIATLRGTSKARWEQAMWVDHFLAECVLVGGARRAARIACKDWRDPTVLDFIHVKKGGELWSANNSVMVDAEFWALVNDKGPGPRGKEPLAAHAKRVFKEITEASYFDGTGEPGIINQDKLTSNTDGIDDYLDGDFIASARYTLSSATKSLIEALVQAFKGLKYKFIVNPCAEIVLSKLGGYCVIADVVPYFAEGSGTLGEAHDERVWDNSAESAFRAATRALIRTNLMDALYGPEVKRTNRIGVGITGIHEWAWARFGFGFRDLIDEQKSQPFWQTLSRFKRAVDQEADRYSARLGVNPPHTTTTAKPAGTTSKLFALTEGMHLPAMAEYLRWVQFRNDDPLIEDYRARGYPVRQLKVYEGTTIVGFPTQPTICTLGMGDKLVTAAEATPAEQYQWLRLLEKYWITGVAEDGVTPLPERGNQLSYTLKFDPNVVGYEDFQQMMLEGQASVRCCSVMPQTDTSAYEYVPEQSITRAEYDALIAKIEAAEKEDIGFEHVDCGGGACPISWDENDKEDEKAA